MGRGLGWSKGLTKELDSGVAKRAESMEGKHWKMKKQHSEAKGRPKPWSKNNRFPFAKGEKKPWVTERLLTNHPMHNPEIKARQAQSLKKLFYYYPERTTRQISNLKAAKSPSKPQIELFRRIKQRMLYNVYLNYKIRTNGYHRFIDIAIPDLMLAFEYDGWYYHQDSQADMERELELLDLGWSVFHFGEEGFRFGNISRKVHAFLEKEND